MIHAIHFTARIHLRVLIYNGEFDLNCNFLGTQHTLERNLWGKNRNLEWKDAHRSLWVVEGNVAGKHYELGNLSFLIVSGAGSLYSCTFNVCDRSTPVLISFPNLGHLMPMDKPRQALDMLTRFLDGSSFADRDLPSAGKLC